jgi:hypothetical protein
MTVQQEEIELYTYQHSDDSKLTSNVIIIVHTEWRDGPMIWWKSVGSRMETLGLPQNMHTLGKKNDSPGSR